MQETQETWVPSLGREDPLEEEMATHSSILAWRIPWTEEFGGLQSVGSQSEVKWKSLSHVWIFTTPWTTQSMEFSRPEYWSG